MKVMPNVLIKTHDSESRGQEEAGCTRLTSELFHGEYTIYGYLHVALL